MAADGTDGSGLVINRNMAQALEVPMESWTVTGRCSLLRAIDQPRATFQIAAPA